MKNFSVPNGLLLLVTVFALNACSSGGDSSPTAIPLETSVIRAYQQGDTFTATVTLRDTATGNTASGTVTFTVGSIVQNPYGIDCRSYTISGTITGPGGTVALNERALFYQDASNSDHDCGEFSDTLGRYVFLTDTATSPNGVFLDQKSPVQLGDSTSGVIYFDDGSWEDCTKTVVAKENVSVPLGVYESYKINSSCSYSDGTTSSSTQWMVPSIMDLKETGVVDGVSIEIQVTEYQFN